jgi:hypothetical protein
VHLPRCSPDDRPSRSRTISADVVAIEGTTLAAGLLYFNRNARSLEAT